MAIIVIISTTTKITTIIVISTAIVISTVITTRQGYGFSSGMYDVRVGLWRKLITEELMLLNCDVGEDFWESLQGDPTSSFWRRSVLGVLWKDWCWNWNSNTLTTSCKELTHWKRPWCWEGLGAEGEGDDRGCTLVAPKAYIPCLAVVFKSQYQVMRRTDVNPRYSVKMLRLLLSH